MEFSLEIDDRTDKEREEEAKRKSCQAIGKAKTPMDTDLQEDLGYACPQIRINPDFSRKIQQAEGIPDHQAMSDTQSKIQGIKPKPDQHKKFDFKRLFDAVSCGDITRLEGLEEYLSDKNKKLTSPYYVRNGKTVLMKALLNLKNGDNKTVEYLLGIAERKDYLHELVNAAFTDSYYRGQTALHIAIEKRNKRFAELLIQKGANVHAKAYGKFFRPLNETCFYFGELPLSLAACTNQKDIVDLLMDKADVRCTDTLGNTVLHALVMVADNSPENTHFVISMYDYILTKDAAKNPKQKELEDIENNQGLTSIKLAAKLGKIGLLEHILHREFQQEECRHLSRMFREWVYGPVCGSLYDLDSIDTCERNSVLEIVVYGPEIPNRLEMLQIEPLNKLLEDKWNRFAKWIFLFKFIVYFIYLIIFTAGSYHREEGTPPFPIRKNTAGYLLLAGHVIMVVGSLYFLVTVVMDIRKKRPSLQTLLVDGYSDLLFVALCWVNLLYFSRGTQHMGIYNIMIQRIFLGDILRFLFVYIVFLIGFSAAMVTLLHEPKKRSSLYTDNKNVTEGCTKPTFKTISFTTLELFKFTIGMGDLEFTEEYEYKHVFYVLLISYIVLTYILLLNMLIALMSKTVDNMSEESTSIWKLQRAIIILDLERYACCLKMKLRSGVRRNLGKKKEDWRWCFRVEEVNWKNWNHNLGIISEDPGECKTVMRTEPSQELSQCDVSRQRSKRQTGDETHPLVSSPV
ncbi:hypothetical protein PDJAM_G00166080 [Pangasius djambal]|uniref:Uncharacterized protein n=1 Tax=Pangasius djambal TaxID=1691987 RepID=A0ACC5ZKJ9_9TELE|nr:hypothetical protein [Pangasius djambal]